jgi:hypothetical protein
MCPLLLPRAGPWHKLEQVAELATCGDHLLPGATAWPRLQPIASYSIGTGSPQDI